MKIEKDIPIPRRIRKTFSCDLVLKKMEVGDSIRIKDMVHYKKIYARMYYLKKIQTLDKDYKITVRAGVPVKVPTTAVSYRIEVSYRIWRIQ